MSVAISFVAFNKGVKISPRAIREYFESTWPTVPQVVLDKKSKETLSYSVGEDFVVYGLMPAPIPWSDLEKPCKASWLWPEAVKEMQGHASHIIVTAMSKGNPIDQQALLTQATASLVATTNQVAGVYWGGSALVMSPNMLCDMATEVLPVEWPLHLWIDMPTGKTKTGKVCGYTKGLESLGHMEFETLDSSDPPGELKDRFYGLANYILENGPVINDGDTIGADEHEKIKVVYADSKFGCENQVMRLVYEPL